MGKYTLKDVPVGKQKEVARLLLQEGGKSLEVAAQLAIPFYLVWECVKEHKAEFQEPYEQHIPEGQSLKGVSKLVDSDGNIKQQWIKTDKDARDKYEALKLLADQLKKDITPIEPLPYKGRCKTKLLTEIVVSDYHMGMYAARCETGEEWNLQIGEHVLKSYFEHAIDRAEKAAECVLVNLGDMCHIDGNTPYTTSRKHAIDVSGRFPEMRAAIVRCFDYAVQKALKKFKTVRLIYVSGNHDQYCSPLIRDLIARKYEDNPRFTVDKTESLYHSHQWGQTALFYHHGHKRVNVKALSETFTTMFADIYGMTKYRYGHVGHTHHEETSKEHGIIMRRHPTLIPMDEYAHNGGYSGQRGAFVSTYHKQYGLDNTFIIRPEQLI